MRAIGDPDDAGTTRRLTVGDTGAMAMDDWQGEPIALHIVTPPGLRRPARVQRLIDYLAERLQREPWAATAGITD